MIMYYSFKAILLIKLKESYFDGGKGGGGIRGTEGTLPRRRRDGCRIRETVGTIP